MLLMIWTILKVTVRTAGFLILAILAAAVILFLVALSLLLFVPVRYEASASKQAALDADARARWLFGALSVRVWLRQKKMGYHVRLLGRQLLGSEPEEKRGRNGRGKQKRGRETKTPEQNTETAENKGTAQSTETAESAGNSAYEKKAGYENGLESVENSGDADALERAKKAGYENGLESVENSGDADALERAKKAEYEYSVNAQVETRAGQTEDQQEPPRRISVLGRLRALWEKARDRVRAMWEKAKNGVRAVLRKVRDIREKAARLRALVSDFLEIWRDEHTREAIAHGKRELRYLGKHYLPRVLHGDVRFGLSDPAATGQLLGALSVVQVFSNGRFRVDADFTAPRLDGNVFLAGHIRVIHLAKSAISLLLDKHLRITVARSRAFAAAVRG